MKIHMRRALAALAALALTAAGPVGAAQASTLGGHTTKATKVFTLDPSTSGNNPEGVAWDDRSDTFFVGTVGTGVIYRATLRDTTLRPFITPDPAPPADSAVGMKVARGKLYVAGGQTGSIYVYQIATGKLLARFETGTGGFLNDLTVTRRGDVYVTDSFRPTLWHLTPAMVRAGSGTPEAIDVGPEIPYTANQFNLNGIVNRHGGHELIVVNTFTMSLFRIRIDHENTAARTITRIDAPPLAGDGLLLDRGRLLVVTGSPAAVTTLKLARHDTQAHVTNVLTDPSLRGPSTVARAKNRYLVVNADFTNNTQPYTVSALFRGPRHGHH
ncbi:MAG: SMP-30/gluconolactonase/LRE family protein [Actinomycetes bacterium]